MKKFILLIVSIFLSLFLYGCPPQDEPIPENLQNYVSSEYVNIEFFSYDQVGNDDLLVFFMDFQYKNHNADMIYFKGNSFEVKDAKIYGNSLNKITIDHEEYYQIDINLLEIDRYMQCYLFIYVDKNTVTNNMTYNKYLDLNAAINQFKMIFDNTNDHEQVNTFYNFFMSQERMTNQIQNFDIYFDLTEFFSSSIYNELYLPFNNQDVVDVQKEILVYRSLENFTIINAENYTLYLRVSDYEDSNQYSEYEEYNINNIKFNVLVTGPRFTTILIHMVYGNKFIEYNYVLDTYKNESLISFLTSIKLYSTE
jgi:hypothetical protein